MIKQAVILAAGKGTRMKELAVNEPKHVVSVAQRPFLFYLFENLSLAGIEKIIAVVGYQKEAAIKKIKGWHGQVDIIDQYEFVPAEKYGTLCPVLAAQQSVGKDAFLVINGDNLYSADDLRNLAADADFNYASGQVHDHPEKYGVLIKNENSLLERIIEKPKEYVGNLINSGLYAFTPEIFKAAESVSLSPRGEYELTDAVTNLAKAGRVKIKILKDYWLDLTKPEDVKVVEEFIKKNKI